MWLWKRAQKVREIEPDEIFLDSSNLPRLDESQFEGRVEYPISHIAILSVGLVFLLGALIFIGRAFDLQILNGDVYADISRDNRLERSVVFAPRGIIYDRTGVPLAWNEAPASAMADAGAEVPPHAVRVGDEASLENTVSSQTTTHEKATSTEDYPLRSYIDEGGFAHVLGFVRYPRQDPRGEWWREDYAGVSGVELVFDALLRGENGSRLIETDARGVIQREGLVIPVVEGSDVRLTIDADVQATLYQLLSEHARVQGFQGGAAVIMDVQNGEILALTSFPEYDNAAFASGERGVIGAANNDPKTPLLNRAVSGVFSPGSIVKPILAAAALQEGIISPEKEIFSTGELVVPNPYDPTRPSIFRDWKAHGWVDMRAALAVSSDQYFYTIGGGLPAAVAAQAGFESQQGLGIERIDRYARAFGLGTPTGVSLFGEAAGVIPTPEWKRETFGDNDPWRLGDTYITSIGQFGFQITPLQAARYTAAIANGGELVTPRLTPASFVMLPLSQSVGVSDEHLAVIREGMRMAVSSEWPDRTARALDMAGLDIAGKTGTAQVGEHNQFMNSWVIGFWPACAADCVAAGRPAEKPHYAFAVVLERAPAGTLSGAAPAMRPFFEWLVVHKPEYLK